MVGTAAVTAAAASSVPVGPVDEAPAFVPGLPVAERTTSSAARLALGIAASARTGFLEAGTANARQALADCRKGDYPGGGSGLFSLPAPGRSNARSDHCWR